MPNKIGEYLYNNLPSIYKIKDGETNYTLQKFLNALGESMSNVEEETRQLLTLLDVEKMDAKYLPYFASMFGVTYSYDIAEEFQRKYLANLVDIQKRKGTQEAIEFTARELTGMEATIREGKSSIFRTWGTENNINGYVTSKQNKTFNGRTSSYFFGGENTDRFTITVILNADGNTDSDELFLNTQLISRHTKELVQPYIKLRYKSFGIAYSDIGTVSNISEHDVIRIRDLASRKVKTIEGNLLYKSKDEHTETYTIKDIDTRHRQKIQLLDCDTDVYSDFTGEDTFEDKLLVLNLDTKRLDITNEDRSLFKQHYSEEGTLEYIEQFMDHIHSRLIEEVPTLNYVEDQRVDYIQSNNISDIINLGELISDSFEDKITEISTEDTEQ